MRKSFSLLYISLFHLDHVDQNYRFGDCCVAFFLSKLAIYRCFNIKFDSCQQLFNFRYTNVSIIHHLHKVVLCMM